MINYISLFSGIGAFEKALTNIGLDFNLINYCEIDKFASKAYSILYEVSEDKNLWDITNVDIDNLPTNIDLITYGFCCQDVSIAGKRKGLFNEDGSLTRSGLFFEALKIINHCRPKVAIAENVKNLVGKKMKGQFDLILDSLDSIGYNNYWQVLDAQDYGMAQHRERVFIISIRKDIDTIGFSFPEKIPLDCCMKDFLEENVSEKYFLSKERTAKALTPTSIKYSNVITDVAGSSVTLCARDYKSPKVIRDLNYYKYEKFNRVDSIEGSSPTLTAVCGGGQEIRILDEKERYRYLTPREYFRLMGFEDSDVDKLIDAGFSKTRLYKMAGNSIVVNVLEHLFNNLKGVYL